MAQYTLSSKQLEKLKTQLHGKHQTISTHAANSQAYSLISDLRKVFIVSSLILIGQLSLLKFI